MTTASIQSQINPSARVDMLDQILFGESTAMFEGKGQGVDLLFEVSKSDQGYTLKVRQYSDSGRGGTFNDTHIVSNL